jgi:spermidine synthase
LNIATRGSQNSILERLSTPRGELQLKQIRLGDETHHELVFNGVFLMASYNAPSSQVLADGVLDGMGFRRNAELLIGGLGMGFALRRVLARREVRKVCVVELLPQIAAWNRRYLGNRDVLDDIRTELVIGDVHDFLHGHPKSYDGIMMDIDNGPDWVVREENRRMYSLSTLNLLRIRLRPRGAMGIWAHAPNRGCEQALAEVFGQVTVQEARDFDLAGKPLDSVVYIVQG